MPIRTRIAVLASFSLAAALLLAGELAVHAQAPDTLGVRHVARAIQPGEVVLIAVTNSSPLESVRGEVWDRAIGFRPGQGADVWIGLVGIDLDTKAGNHEVRVSATTRDGQELFARHALKVVPKKFPERRLSVAPRFTEPSKKDQERIAREQERLRKLYASMTPEALWEDGFVLPVDSAVTSVFGVRRTFNGRTQSVHRGLDLRGTVGTPIAAPNAGRVALADDLFYSGNTVILDHGQGLISVLAHMSAIKVREGDMVTTGTVVGEVGATGRVTGPHLHWTLRLGGVTVDPQSLVTVTGKLDSLAP
jgi:murein DD-endopeptidase MepM/ murein hydrolase activator NlpD